MRLEKKDIALLVPATLLAIAGLGPDDPWVIVPCLIFSCLSFVLICWFHEGSRRWRALIAIIITAAMAGLTYRRLGRIFEGASNSSHPLNSLVHFLSSFWIWLWSPHGRWFDKLVGVIYAVAALFIFLVIAAAIKLIKGQQEKGNKGFLDYKFEAETAMQEMPRILAKLTSIMNEVGPAMTKYTAELTRAKSTAAQIRVSKRVALSFSRPRISLDTEL